MSDHPVGLTGLSTSIVLFTDLVESTELRSRMGEDAAEEVRHKLGEGAGS